MSMVPIGYRLIIRHLMKYTRISVIRNSFSVSATVAMRLKRTCRAGMIFDVRAKHDDNGKGLYSVLCLGAHAGDIEIGYGGTILRSIQMFGRGVEFHWVVFSAQQEAESSGGRRPVFEPGP